MNSVSFEQELAVVLNSKHADSFLKEESYDYKSIFLIRIVPDSTNPRFFPAIIMSDQHALQLATGKLTKKQLLAIYNAEGHVLIGKSCVVNCFKHGTEDWKKANASIESIIELAANVCVSEIIQVPTVYPVDNGCYQILTGHRRFFALIYATGVNGAAHFKVYANKPVLPKTKQFQENASREELPQYGKLLAFQDALFEIETLNNVRRKTGRKPYTVRETANILGISMGSFDNYNVLVRYPSVRTAYENGHSLPFVKMKKIVLETERQYREENQCRVFNINDKRNIDQLIKDTITGGKDSRAVNKSFKINGIESVDGLKLLLQSNLLELVSEVQWEQLDWSNKESVNGALQIILKYLNDQSPHA